MKTSTINYKIYLNSRKGFGTKPIVQYVYTHAFKVIILIFFKFCEEILSVIAWDMFVGQANPIIFIAVGRGGHRFWF